MRFPDAASEVEAVQPLPVSHITLYGRDYSSAGEPALGNMKTDKSLDGGLD